MFWFFGALFSLLISVSAQAAAIGVTATFKPDPGNPMRNEFINTTPFTGHCSIYPTFCEGLSIFSILVPIEFNSIGPIEAGHTDTRKGAMFKPPTEWTSLQVTHQETGEQSTLQVRIASIGGRYYLPDRVQNIIGEGAPDSNPDAHEMLWSGYNWTYPPAPCGYTGGMFVEPTWRSFFWLTPPGSSCVPTAAYRIESLRYDMFQIGYELRTPNPLEMTPGQYIGSLTYGVGPGRDFDLGDIMLPTDDSLMINFNLDVQHTLQVEIPPGGDKVQLVPAGGWQSWLQAGRKPVRLFRDQTFTISASSRFKMQLECGKALLFNCLVVDPVSGREAVVQVSVSLPNGLTDLAGQPVHRQPLRIGLGQERQVFQPGHFVHREPGILHFEMSPYYVNQIVQPGVAARYVGNIAVIWDSEV
ncbi:hypothetical protein [Pseudomonas sp. NFX98]|uniref:hypothetical protein n=1 Tax=Pseudomonas sp. NFX98 TaxID=3399122 RepID=UPI0039FD8286